MVCLLWYFAIFAAYIFCLRIRLPSDEPGADTTLAAADEKNSTAKKPNVIKKTNTSISKYMWLVRHLVKGGSRRRSFVLDIACGIHSLKYILL